MVRGMVIDPSFGGGGVRPALVFFERPELDRLLRLYGRMVARGDWRDYAIDGGRDCATFSVFRRSGENPLYRVEKRPALARRQGAFSVIDQGGLILRRSHELEGVLQVFEARKFRIVD